MKRFLLTLFIMPAFFASVYGQCAFNNSLNSTVTPPCPGSTTVACVNGGQYVAVNVTSGNTYTFSTCGASFDTQITLYNSAGTTVLGYNDDFCSLQSTVVWTSTLTGVVNVLVDLYPCSNNAACAPLVVTCALPPAPCVGGSNNTCATADPFCTGTTYNYCNTTGNPSLGSYGCLITTPNAMWMYLNIATSGNLTIVISQKNNANAGIDVDYALYGPFGSLAAACPINGGTTPYGCSYSPSPTETVTITGAVAGQWYMLLITNYANQAGYIQFSQTAGTGSTNCAIVLPVELTTFKGEALDGYNKISWKTATERNNDYFKVESSVDGQSWKEINRVNGSGNSFTEKKYSVNDVNFSSAINYYRLIQVDYDGHSESSYIIVVDNSKISNPKLIKIVDVFGQPVDDNYNGVKIYCYDDGTYIKKVEINHQ